MQDLVRTFTERRSDLVSALGQHLQISLIALIIAMVIAMPLAYWGVQHKRFSGVMLQVTGVLQTIPSLALLGLLIPLVGIGTVPAIIALVVYALLPIFQNTYLGLTGIDPSLLEAADAFGMKRWRKLIKVQLPLAAPTIIGGIRTALVLIIGTATLAALIGAGGLGSFILLGIDRNDTSLIIIGATTSALLAVGLNLIVGWLARHRWIWSAAVAVLLLGVGAGTGIAKMATQTETITIAGKLGSEPDILINMYKQLIEQDNPRVHVQLKENFGKTTFLYSALKKGSIDIYPEFTGTVLETLVKVPAKEANKERTAHQTYTLARKLIARQADMTYLAPMRYENTYALAVPAKWAQQNHVTSISDLKAHTGALHAGFSLEFTDRPDGYSGLKRKYGLTLPYRTLEPALRYTAIRDGRVNVVDAYSTDSELVQYHLRTLTDDQHLFPSYRGAPLMKAEFAKKHPGIVKSLSKLAGRISATEMQQMNYDVNVKKESPAHVARHYLTQHGLLKKGGR
jgi:osmoprotectant transport system permease protein